MDENNLEYESESNKYQLEFENNSDIKEKFITKYIRIIDILMKIYIIFCVLVSTFLFVEMGRVAIFIVMFLIINFIIALIYFISKSTYYRFIIHIFFIFIIFLILSMYLNQ